jgi:hypothetical protein
MMSIAIEAERHAASLARSPRIGSAAFQSGCEHLLSRQARLMQGDAPVGSDRAFAKLRAGAAGAVENDKDLPALRSNLHPEARKIAVSVDHVRLKRRQRVERALCESNSKHGPTSLRQKIRRLHLVPSPLAGEGCRSASRTKNG